MEQVNQATLSRVLSEFGRGYTSHNCINRVKEEVANWKQNYFFPTFKSLKEEEETNKSPSMFVQVMWISGKTTET